MNEVMGLCREAPTQPNRVKSQTSASGYSFSSIQILLPPGPQGELSVSEQGEGTGATEYEWLHSYAFNGGIFLLY